MPWIDLNTCDTIYDSVTHIALVTQTSTHISGMCVCIHVCLQLSYKLVLLNTSIYVCMHTYMSKYIYQYVDTNICIRIFTNMLCRYLLMHNYIYLWKQRKCPYVLSLGTYIALKKVLMVLHSMLYLDIYWEPWWKNTQGTSFPPWRNYFYLLQRKCHIG